MAHGERQTTATSNPHDQIQTADKLSDNQCLADQISYNGFVIDAQPTTETAIDHGLRFVDDLPDRNPNGHEPDRDIGHPLAAQVKLINKIPSEHWVYLDPHIGTIYSKNHPENTGILVREPSQEAKVNEVANKMAHLEALADMGFILSGIHSFPEGTQVSSSGFVFARGSTGTELRQIAGENSEKWLSILNGHEERPSIHDLAQKTDSETTQTLAQLIETCIAASADTDEQSQEETQTDKLTGDQPVNLIQAISHTADFLEWRRIHNSINRDPHLEENDSGEYYFHAFDTSRDLTLKDLLDYMGDQEDLGTRVFLNPGDTESPLTILNKYDDRWVQMFVSATGELNGISGLDKNGRPTQELELNETSIKFAKTLTSPEHPGSLSAQELADTLADLKLSVVAKASTPYVAEAFIQLLSLEVPATIIDKQITKLNPRTDKAQLIGIDDIGNPRSGETNLALTDNLGNTLNIDIPPVQESPLTWDLADDETVNPVWDQQRMLTELLTGESLAGAGVIVVGNNIYLKEPVSGVSSIRTDSDPTKPSLVKLEGQTEFVDISSLSNFDQAKITDLAKKLSTQAEQIFQIGKKDQAVRICLVGSQVLQESADKTHDQITTAQLHTLLGEQGQKHPVFAYLRGAYKQSKEPTTKLSERSKQVSVASHILPETLQLNLERQTFKVLSKVLYNGQSYNVTVELTQNSAGEYGFSCYQSRMATVDDHENKIAKEFVEPREVKKGGLAGALGRVETRDVVIKKLVPGKKVVEQKIPVNPFVAQLAQEALRYPIDQDIAKKLSILQARNQIAKGNPVVWKQATQLEALDLTYNNMDKNKGKSVLIVSHKDDAGEDQDFMLMKTPKGWQVITQQKQKGRVIEIGRIIPTTAEWTDMNSLLNLHLNKSSLPGTLSKQMVDKLKQISQTGIIDIPENPPLPGIKKPEPKKPKPKAEKPDTDKVTAAPETSAKRNSLFRRLFQRT